MESFTIQCYLVLLALVLGIVSATDDGSDIKFGSPREFSQAPAADQPNVHPRVLFNQEEFEALVDRYALDTGVDRSWEDYFLWYTHSIHGPKNEPLLLLEELPVEGMTKETLAGYIESLGQYKNGRNARMGEHSSTAMIMMTLHAFVDTRRDGTESPLFQRITTVMDKWSQAILAHHDLFDCKAGAPSEGSCTPKNRTSLNSFIWSSGWNLWHERFTGVLGLSMSYDLMYNKLSETPEGLVVRERVRKAISTIVAGRASWGMTLPDTRIHSNWGPYHSHLWIANLAIEGDGHDPTVATEFPRVLAAFMRNMIYPEGGTLEDSYTLGIALREGSSALVAAARRGVNHMDTPKFRKFIEFSAAMFEPWACGAIIGGSSGGGHQYPSFAALFRYAYPEGKLTKMLWRQRMGDNYKGDGVCRAEYYQVNAQLFMLGASHSIDAAKEPSGLLPLSHYDPNRGLVIARSTMDPNPSLYTHFDARGDAFMLGHDNADRGTFTLSAFGKTLIPELPWSRWKLSEHHSLLHIDGAAQVLKAPGANMTSVSDDGKILIASADLTKSYSTQWYPSWPNHRYMWWYLQRGWVADTASPADYGWKSSSYDDEIELPASLHGHENYGFHGMFVLKRPHMDISYVTRSTAHVRDAASPAGAYFLIVDRALVGDNAPHNYTFQAVLQTGLAEDTDLSKPGTIVLTDESSGTMLDVHVVSSLGGAVSHEIRSVQIGSSSRDITDVLFINSEAVEEELWIMMHPRLPGHERLTTKFARDEQSGTPLLEVQAFGSETSNFFSLSSDGSLEVASDPSAAAPPTDEAITEANGPVTVPPAESDDETASNPSPEAELESSEPPMSAIDLPVLTSHMTKVTEIQTDSSVFLLPDAVSSAAQVVFKFTEASTTIERMTSINVCNDYTIGETTTTLVTCANYAERECTVVDGGFSANNCSETENGINKILTQGQEYFAIVGITPVEGVFPQVKAVHTRIPAYDA